MAAIGEMALSSGADADSGRDDGGLEPVYFGRDGNPLFGCYHPAQGPARAGRAVLICSSLGQEYIRCHRPLRVLAGSLAQAGLPVLRFDYYGCGDSRGDCGEIRLGRCMEDVGDAMRYMRGRARALSVDVVGVRLGASIALRFAAGGRGQVGRLVLWDPVVRGREFLASMQEQHARFRKWCVATFRRAARPEECDGPRDFMGFRFAQQLVDELAALDLRQVAERPCQRAWILDTGENPGVAALHGRLGELGVHSRLERRSAPKIWLAEPYQSVVPRESLDLVTHWLLEESR